MHGDSSSKKIEHKQLSMSPLDVEDESDLVSSDTERAQERPPDELDSRKRMSERNTISAKKE